MKKKDGFVSIVKGFIIGLSMLVKGISPASIVLSLNSYENIIESLNKKEAKDKLKLITIPILIGIIIGFLAGTHLIDYFWNNYKVQTILLFVGLIIGGIRIITKKETLKLNKINIIISIIAFIIMIAGYLYLKDKNITNNSFISGIILGISLIIPGISILSINLLIEFSIIKTIIFIVMTLISLLLMSKLINYLFNKNKNNTYIVLIVLMLSSVIIALLQINKINLNFVTIFTTILAFLWGYILAKNIINE